MNTVHLVLTKEALKQGMCSDATAIVLDIIFATSSITAALESGAHRVIPALSLDEAEQISKRLIPGGWILAGEKDAEAFTGYRSYEPLALLTPDMAGKDLVYATTNGTVALRRAEFFKRVYAASLRNGPAVARQALHYACGTSGIVIVCAGSRGHFSLEDFYGAGYIVQCLRRFSNQRLLYSDAAIAAELAFQNTDTYDVLTKSRLGQIMLARDMKDSIQYISQLDSSDAVGLYENGCVSNASIQK